MKILLVDDDTDTLDVTAYALRREGFNVIVAVDGAQALRRWEADEPDLVLTDISLPQVNGIDLCRKIREGSHTPVILLSAANDEESIEQGFRSGADDYVTKPFSPKQLAMRIRAVLRRASGNTATVNQRLLTVGDLELDLEAHQVVLRNGERVQLTPLEFRIFHVLALNEGRVVPFSRLVEYGWGYDGGEPTMLKTHVSHIRKKLQLGPGRPGYIQVLHGIGYLMQKSAVAEAVMSLN
jgi:DNA-binding response OmpR family regulator